MPPTIGAAMRCITSAPVPEPYMIGARPAMMTAKVIIMGLKRRSAPLPIASRRSSTVTQIHYHQDPDLDRDACKRNETNGDCYRHIETEYPHQPDTTDQGER